MNLILLFFTSILCIHNSKGFLEKLRRMRAAQLPLSQRVSKYFKCKNKLVNNYESALKYSNCYLKGLSKSLTTYQEYSIDYKHFMKRVKSGCRLSKRVKFGNLYINRGLFETMRITLRKGKILGHLAEIEKGNTTSLHKCFSKFHSLIYCPTYLKGNITISILLTYIREIVSNEKEYKNHPTADRYAAALFVIITSEITFHNTDDLKLLLLDHLLIQPEHDEILLKLSQKDITEYMNLLIDYKMFPSIYLDFLQKNYETTSCTTKLTKQLMTNHYFKNENLEFLLGQIYSHRPKLIETAKISCEETLIWMMFPLFGFFPPLISPKIFDRGKNATKMIRMPALFTEGCVTNLMKTALVEPVKDYLNRLNSFLIEKFKSDVYETPKGSISNILKDNSHIGNMVNLRNVDDVKETITQLPPDLAKGNPWANILITFFTNK
ncbi:hypothetical protein SNEBB_011140 [Seison nebaliae]|nr:hypothetical protein SNEBB_011140 [Seison nebaliae]